MMELNYIIDILFFAYEVTNWIIKWLSIYHWLFNISICFLPYSWIIIYIYIIIFIFRQPIGWYNWYHPNIGYDYFLYHIF